MESYQIDVVDNGAIVKVFLLEGAFPWNTPERILDSAGGFWESYGMLPFVPILLFSAHASDDASVRVLLAPSIF